VTTGPQWSVVIDGFDVSQERVHEALLTLADGQVGTSGASLAPNPNQHPWVVAAGIYHGVEAHSHPAHRNACLRTDTGLLSPAGVTVLGFLAVDSSSPATAHV